MPNQLIVNMHEVYPFGTEYVPQRPNQQVLVRKLLFTTNKQELLSKIKFFQKLNIPNTIKILSILQHPKSIEIYYEYVGIRFEMWMKNMSEELQANLLKQLYAISRFLADNKISTKFIPQNIGLDKNYHIKYFVDPQSIIHDFRLNSKQLKELFDQEISMFIKSIDQKQGKINQKQKLFTSQLKLNKQLQKSQISIIDRNLDRTYSVKTFNEKLNNKKQIPTQASSNQYEAEIKQQTYLSKSQKVSFNDKINKIKQQLKFAKEQNAKMNRSVIDLKNSNRNPQNQIKNALLQKKSQNKFKTSKTVSFQNDVENQQQSHKWTKPQNDHHPEFERQNSQKIISFALKQEKKIRSQKYKTPKNSQSPIQYLDMVRSPSAYVLDFLNVLEDSLQQQKSQRQDQCFTKTQLNQKSRIKTQQSINDNQRNDLEWKNKFDKVIQNSKKLITRMRTQSKIVIN